MGGSLLVKKTYENVSDIDIEISAMDMTIPMTQKDKREIRLVK